MSSYAPNGHNGNGHSKYAVVPNRPPSRQMTVGDIARMLGAEMVGDAQTLISGVCSLDSASPGAIAFIENEGLLETALGSVASALIVPAAIAERVRVAQELGEMRGKPVVLSEKPRLAFAKVMEYLLPPDLPEPGIHPTAIIEKDAHIGEGVTIREFCYVGHRAHIGDGAVLFPHVVVGHGAQIGNASVLYPSVIINHQVCVGERVRIHSGSVIGGDGFGYVLDEGKHHKVPQIGIVIIEDDVEIGANVCIDRAMLGATRVGSGTKVDNLVQIAHNVQIGRNVILCGQVGLSGSVVVEDNAVIAGQVGARDHVRIGKGVTIGAQSGVINDIPADSFMLGSPAMPHRHFLKQEAAARKLPEALRTLCQLERQVKELQSLVEKLSVEQSPTETCNENELAVNS